MENREKIIGEMRNFFRINGITQTDIAEALGHGASSVTDIYINPDLRKIDDANRRIIEYIKNY